MTTLILYVHENNLNGALTNLVLKCIEIGMYNEQVWFIPGIHDLVPHLNSISTICNINALKQKKNQTYAENLFNICHPLRIKMISKIGRERSFFNMLRVFC